MVLSVAIASETFRVDVASVENIFVWTVSTKSVLISLSKSVESAMHGIVLIACMKVDSTLVMVSVVVMEEIFGGGEDEYKAVARVA